MRLKLTVAGLGVFVAALHGQSPSTVAPSVDQLLSLKRVASPRISPDGSRVAYTLRETNWEDNAYETEIWVADVRTGSSRQLTNGKKSSLAPAWSPDGSRVAFISDRTDKRQIYVIDPLGGEAEVLTTVEDGVSDFAWSPDGRAIAYSATEPKSAAVKDRDQKYGEFEIVDQDRRRMKQLFLFDVASRQMVRALTSTAYNVGNFDWSPDGRFIAFEHRRSSDPADLGTADISVVTVADAAVRTLVTQDGPDTNPFWSPDGSRIAFESAMANPTFFYTNGLIAVVPAAGGTPVALTRQFDEDALLVGWKPNGLFFTASQHTWSYLFRLDERTNAVTALTPSKDRIASAFSLSRDGSQVAFLGADAKSMPEVFVSAAAMETPQRLTKMNAQTSEWLSGTREIVEWKSQDQTLIEGVLHKPANFDPSRRYPLLVVIHGGPTAVSRPIPFASTIYPIDLWVARGVLVLEPNYRGSAGYGEKFRSLNVRNLGVGDAWDVISGIDSLVARGLADPGKVGVMGWSQGGYISAFLATNYGARFKAISVGAGISDWMTYYVNTDIHPFTRQYLQATPWDDPAIYAKTSPITTIKQAKAPTLIQHGRVDQRVPLPNAFELFQGLRDHNVPVKLIVYEGFGGVGHGPTKPKSHRATMDHNLEWFDDHLFGAQPRTQ
jgi:dipeptidyl aminopeptidase/acylaminoacyl peptidase